MALLGKNKKKASSETAETAAVPPAGEKKTRRLRENERLRSVIKESTFGAAVEALDNNVRFRLMPDAQGNSRWLALLLHAEAIGGLSEKTKRDETKGSLVQQITSDQIEAIATEEMLEREFMSIVPSEGTLNRLGEYSLLANAQYYWIVFTARDGELVFNQNIGPASYSDALTIQTGTPMDRVIAEQADGASIWERINPERQEAPANVAAPESVQAGPAESDNDGDPFTAEPARTASPAPSVVAKPAPIVVPDTVLADWADEDADPTSVYSEMDAGDDDDDADDDLLAPAINHGVADDDVDDQATDWESYDEEGNARTSYEAYVNINTSRNFTEEEVRESIARRFLSDDLDLAVDLAEFDAAFAQSPAPAVSVSTLIPHDGSDWLGAQVAQIGQSANAALSELHERNLDELRQQFVALTSRHIQGVAEEVSLTDESTDFGQLMAAAQRDRDAASATRHQDATQRRREVEQRFTSEADQVAEAAAATARANHRQMNRVRYDTAISQIDREVNLAIEDVYETQRQHVMTLRRADAELGMERGKTLIFEALAQERLSQSEAEGLLLDSWNERMLTIVDDNRKVDVVRAEALAENLARGNAVEDERRDAAARMEQVRADHAQRLAELEARSLAAREEALVQLRDREAAWAHERGQAEARASRSESVVNELQSQITTLSDSIHKQYQDRLASAEVSRDAYASEVTRGNQAAQRNQRTAMLLMVLITVSALIIGVIGGWMVAVAFDGSQAQAMADTVAAVSLPGV